MKTGKKLKQVFTSPLLYTYVNIKDSFNRMPRVTVGAARLRTLMAQ